jgi:DNA/RNA-binding domain of Phe-tRNA-synthetase-like protein
MMFRIDEACLQWGLRAGAIIFRNLRIAPAPPELRAEIDREIREVRSQFASPSAVRSCAEVAAFQQLHRRAGVSPRKKQSSVERLLLFGGKQRPLVLGVARLAAASA